MPDSATRTTVAGSDAISSRWRPAVDLHGLAGRARSRRSPPRRWPPRARTRPRRGPRRARPCPAGRASSISRRASSSLDHGQDHEDRVGAGQPLGGDLLREDGEVLGERGERRGRAGLGEVARGCRRSRAGRRAPTWPTRRPRRRPRRCPRCRVGCDVALRRRCALDLGDHGHVRAGRQRGCKAACRGGRRRAELGSQGLEVAAHTGGSARGPG